MQFRSIAMRKCNRLVRNYTGRVLRFYVANKKAQKLARIQNLSNRERKFAGAGALGGKMKKKLKMGQVLEKKILPVETDPHKLVNFVCGSNILKEGGQDIEIKPDLEYPDWLWDIHVGPPKKLEELDPNSLEYWRKVKKAAMRRHNLLAKLKPF